jgi:K+-sensing histidine kinase KdpD
MGVGLAICRRIAEAQGGVIIVGAGEERGTVFTLSLPLPPAALGGPTLLSVEGGPVSPAGMAA